MQRQHEQITFNGYFDSFIAHCLSEISIDSARRALILLKCFKHGVNTSVQNLEDKCCFELMNLWEASEVDEFHVKRYYHI